MLLFLPGLGQAESCKEKLERTIQEISQSREVRFHGLPDSTVRYRSFILDNEPKLKRPITLNNESAKQRLGKMYNNSKTSDVEYMMENRMLEADFRGGEASIFLNPRKPEEAVKVWNKSRADDFEMSTRAMLLFEQRVEQSNTLKNYFAVAKIKEMGKDYIVREFSPNSVELKKMVDSPEVKKAVKALKRELSKSSDVINQKLMVALNKKPVSANLHWDPDTKKVLMIDALGF